MNNLKQTALKTIKRENMINYGDTIVVGVSGGADSVALLYFLYSIRNEFGLNIKVCHVNHKIRKGGTAERDAKFVKNLCEILGVEFFLKEIDIPSISKEKKQSEELVGREERYKFFNEIAGEYGKIATAHNKNDNVETLLMRLVRGTGLNGLSGIPYKRGNIIRPILDVERKTIEQYLVDNKLEHIVDETNLEQDYTRNKIRLSLLPFICKNFNENAINSIGDMITSYSDDNQYIESQVDCAQKEVVGDNFSIKIESFNKYPNSIRNRIIIRCIKGVINNNSLSVSQKTVEGIIHIADGCQTSIVKVGKNYYAYFKNGYIVFSNKPMEEKCVRPVKPVTITKGTIELKNNTKIKVEMVSANNVICNERVQYVPVSMCKNLVFRYKVNGDRFLAQPDMHQKIKKIDGYMLCSGNEVLWIPGKKAMRLSVRSGKFLKFELTD